MLARMKRQQVFFAQSFVKARALGLLIATRCSALSKSESGPAVLDSMRSLNVVPKGRPYGALDPAPMTKFLAVGRQRGASTHHLPRRTQPGADRGAGAERGAARAAGAVEPEPPPRGAKPDRGAGDPPLPRMPGDPCGAP